MGRKKGYKHPEETKRNIREAWKLKKLAGYNFPKHSEEAKRKMSEVKKGKQRSKKN